ncbi:MAG TPA: glycosyltransferase family A protein [Flavobacteriales bacterium]
MLVSVIIPCYNVEDYVEECVESVLRQVYQPVEVICIDNNSSDGTWRKLQTLHERYPQIIIDRELKPGANAARNKGFALSKGEWIQFLDADDLLDEQKLWHQLVLIQQSTTAPSFIAANYTIQRMDGQRRTVVTDVQNPFVGVFINKAGITSGNLWNRCALEKIGAWNEDLRSSQEADLMMRLVLTGALPLEDKTSLTTIRERASGQISQSNPARKWKQYIDVRLSYLQQLKSQHPEVYNRHLGLFHDFLMVSIITLYKHDAEAAENYFRQHIQPRWKSQGLYGISSFKRLLIKLFGLRAVAR